MGHLSTDSLFVKKTSTDGAASKPNPALKNRFAKALQAPAQRQVQRLDDAGASERGTGKGTSESRGIHYDFNSLSSLAPP
jgi:hypothetical protein